MLEAHRIFFKRSNILLEIRKQSIFLEGLVKWTQLEMIPIGKKPTKFLYKSFQLKRH
jgi:hypothetical protein